MRYYKLFRKYQGGVGWIEVDPVSLSVQSKTTADVVVETLTSTKFTTYYANGHYYVSLDITKYTLDTDYKLIWTFEMVAGQVQTIEEYFRLSIVGEVTTLVLIPIGGKLNKALARFGDTLLIVEEDGYTAILGKSWSNERVADYWLRQYVRNAMFANTPEIFGGNIIRDVKRSQYYFVYNLHKVTVREDILEQKGTILYINKTCSVYRPSGTAGSMGGTKQSFTLQKEDIRCHLREVTNDLRTERPALLQVASYLLYIQNTESILALDRIVIGDEKYQVEAVDKITYQGIYEAQLSLDKR